jgi:seryl-tRNA synthetase
MDEVLRTRTSLLEIAGDLFRTLRLRGRLVSASDPFFIGSVARLRAYQVAFALKHELTAELPFDRSSVAIGSVNYHEAHFGRAWSIRAGIADAHSCCMGLGLDRWCYAIFAQWGVDATEWPVELRKLLLDG